MISPNHYIAGYVQVVIIKRETRAQVCHELQKVIGYRICALLNMRLKVVRSKIMDRNVAQVPKANGKVIAQITTWARISLNISTLK